MLSAFILNARSYPTVPAFMPTIGTPEEHRSKSFRTKDPSSFDCSFVRKIGTILTHVVLTNVLSFYYTSIIYIIVQTMLSLKLHSMLSIVDNIILVVVRNQIGIFDIRCKLTISMVILAVSSVYIGLYDI